MRVCLKMIHTHISRETFKCLQYTRRQLWHELEFFNQLH